MNCFPSVVVLFSICVHEMFSCPHFREKKSHCIIFFLNMPVVFCFQEENRTAVKQSDLPKQWPKTRQQQWLWAAARGGTRSPLWQAASAWHHKPCQGLGKYWHIKRCLQLCKHHVGIFPNHDSQRTSHGYGRAGRLATVALGIQFCPEAI